MTLVYFNMYSDHKRAGLVYNTVTKTDLFFSRLLIVACFLGFTVANFGQYLFSVTKIDQSPCYLIASFLKYFGYVAYRRYQTWAIFCYSVTVLHRHRGGRM